MESQNFKIIPFGNGQRICPGSPLAVRKLHLITTKTKKILTEVNITLGIDLINGGFFNLR